VFSYSIVLEFAVLLVVEGRRRMKAESLNLARRKTTSNLLMNDALLDECSLFCSADCGATYFVWLVDCYCRLLQPTQD